MPELPKELQDMVGELMEQQEDLFDQMEDMNANITDSADKGIGWDAADGPIGQIIGRADVENVRGRLAREQREFEAFGLTTRGHRARQAVAKERLVFVAEHAPIAEPE